MQTSIKPLKTFGKKTSIISKNKAEPKQNTPKNLLGNSFQKKQSVTFTHKDRENHMHIIGSTGTGKSKFLELLLRQDIKDKKAGLCLIDPHGSLYEEVFRYLVYKHPKLAKRVILFNPAGDTEQIVGFNPIPYDSDYRSYALLILIEACLKAWGQDESKDTPRIRTWLYNIFYPIVVNQLTLLETTPFINIRNSSYREILLKNVNDEMVIGDWQDFERATHTMKQNTIEGAANRLRVFLQDPFIRNIIGQKEKVLNFHEIMNEGKILLINLNGQGKISRENTKLLGIMLVNEIFRASLLRDPLNPNLKPFYFYIDEFGQFVTRDIAKALEECRKYKLFLILAHQHLAQLKKDDEYLYASVLTNCKNKVVFGGLSIDDVKVMTDELVTGFVNLKSIKDEMHSTKVRHIEETRIVRGRSSSISKGESTGQSQGTTETQSSSKGNTETKGEGFSKTNGTTENKGQSHSTGESKSNGITKGQTNGHGTGTSNTTGESESHTQGSSRGTSETDTSGDSKSHIGSNNLLFGSNTGLSHANSKSHSRGTSHSENESHTTGNSNSETNSKTNSHSDSFSESKSRAESKQDTESESKGKSESKSMSTQQSVSTQQSMSNSKGISQSETHTTNKGESTGQSESVVPFLKPVEYKELTTRTFWTKDELHYMEMANMKNQDTGEAFIKIDSKRPIHTKIKFVDSVKIPQLPSLQRNFKNKENKFKEQVFLFNQKYYTPELEARRGYQERQKIFFGEPLNFDEKLLLENDSEIIEAERGENDKTENPFG